ncbi:MAG: aminotransferase class V-fold PLP-dependent enzyme, partial [Clostridia bacterium]|nr:aminotransferase class V-fold PLP-dependent enzyme [Clostridia bacterium]
MNYKYFDNASTTKPSDNVIKCYNNYLEDYFNPSSLYLPSNQVKKNIEQSRLKILKLLNAQPKSYFIFTSSATESNNTALKNGIRRKDKKAIITMGEHSSVYNHAVALKNEGYDIEFANLCGDGTVNIEHLLSLIVTFENSHGTKPSKAYYQEVLNQIGKSPSECLMVGND